MKVYRIVIALILLSVCSCAGHVPAPKIWTQTSPTEWQYSISTLPLGTVHEVAVDTFSSTGCGQTQGGFTTLLGAEQFVEAACANVNSIPTK